MPKAADFVRVERLELSWLTPMTFEVIVYAFHHTRLGNLDDHRVSPLCIPISPPGETNIFALSLIYLILFLSPLLVFDF